MLLVALIVFVGLQCAVRAFRRNIQRLMTKKVKDAQGVFTKLVQQQAAESNQNHTAGNEWWPWSRKSGCEGQKAAFVETCLAEMKAVLTSPLWDGGEEGNATRYFSKSCFIWNDTSSPWEPASRAQVLASPVSTSHAPCNVPAFWTGGVDKSPGFSPFLRDNLNVCLLHHGSARRLQASVFGVSMQEAGYLSSCDRSDSRGAWELGSHLYANYHMNHMTWKANTEHVTHFSVPVFIGHRFGLKRPGEDSILYSFELGALMTMLHSVGSIRSLRGFTLRFEILNFSPSGCPTLSDIPIGFPSRSGNSSKSQNYTLNEILSGKAQSKKDKIIDFKGNIIDFALMRSMMIVICSDCIVADRDGGPTKEEVAACYDAARSTKLPKKPTSTLFEFLTKLKENGFEFNKNLTEMWTALAPEEKQLLQQVTKEKFQA